MDTGSVANVNAVADGSSVASLSVGIVVVGLSVNEEFEGV